MRWFHLAAVALLATAQRVAADLPPFYNDTDYAEGALGRYVYQNYHSTPAFAPRINFVENFTRCDDGSLVFLAPHGRNVPPGPTILDAEGALVWMSGSYGKVYNLRVQHYKGEDYITFWVGDDQVRGHGSGYYLMLNKHYEQVYNISAGNGLTADLHEFIITPEGTGLVTAYEKQIRDLTAIGSRYNVSTYIWESYFQEIELETGRVLFEWKASEHFEWERSYNSVIPFGREAFPWDWYHINSVDKDAAGNYLVSSRYLRNVAYISGTSGRALWELGGKNSSFTDLSNGNATTFAGQHDARWADGQTAITLFDNRADYYYRIEGDSRGVRVRVDLDAMTAEVEAEFYHRPIGIKTTSQGSMQTLANGHVLLGYGYNGIYTEFSRMGELLCDAWFQPTWNIDTGDVQSYRVMKFNWTGIPLTKPGLAFAEGALYMSWLGSTEVRQWKLEHSDRQDEAYEELSAVDKRGFETRVELDARNVQTRRHVRVRALGHDGRELGVSAALDVAEKRKEYAVVKQARIWTGLSRLLIMGLVLLTLATVVYVVWLVWGAELAACSGGVVGGNEPEEEDYESDDEGESCFWECMLLLWSLLPCSGGRRAAAAAAAAAAEVGERAPAGEQRIGLLTRSRQPRARRSMDVGVDVTLSDTDMSDDEAP